MGLSGIGWVDSLWAGAPLMFLIIGLLIFGWLVYRRSLTGDRRRTRVERVGATLRAPVDAALLQWHWAFYRALVIALVPLVAACWRTARSCTHWENYCCLRRSTGGVGWALS